MRGMELQEITLWDASSRDVGKFVAEISTWFEKLDLSGETSVSVNQPIWEVVVQFPVVRVKLL